MDFEIPEEDKERRWFVFAGHECRYVYEPEEAAWYKKIHRCNRCGKCCQGPFAESWPHGSQMIDGVEYCGKVYQSGGDWLCGAAAAPFSCCRDLPKQPPHPDCVMKYERL